MTLADRERTPGIVYAFYSFKGGAGRTMALANVAASLAGWGHSVLVVDWDLEAPGLERFFAAVRPGIGEARTKTPGVVDLIEAKRRGDEGNWRDCLIQVGLGQLSLITAGRNGQPYSSRLHALNFNDLFENHDLGAYIEKLRNEWVAEYDFVLIDSRTGFTDIGGICTVHLADVLVLLFTTTESSVNGVLSVVERARKAQERLPLDRRRLLAVPVPARDESRTEYQSAAEWKKRFAGDFAELYRDWLPSAVTPEEAVELLRIPYVPYWSFGERLPAIEDSTRDPTSLGHAYEILARLIAGRLDWQAAVEGEVPTPPPMPPRSFSGEWLARHRRAAEAGFLESGLIGFMEIYHFSPDASISKSQGDLLAAARQAQVTIHGWPTGLVLSDGEDAPKPLNDGIFARVARGPESWAGPRFSYWTLAKNGDFYSLTSFVEDARRQGTGALWFEVWIARVAEILVHCKKLYGALGVEPGAHVEVAVRFGGLKGRAVGSSPGSPRVETPGVGRVSVENEVTIAPIVFALRDVDTKLLELVKRVCEPLFVLFDFTSFSDQDYSGIISDFLQGRGR